MMRYRGGVKYWRSDGLGLANRGTDVQHPTDWYGLNARMHQSSDIFRPVVVWHDARASPFLSVDISAGAGKEAVVCMLQNRNPGRRLRMLQPLRVYYVSRCSSLVGSNAAGAWRGGKDRAAP